MRTGQKDSASGNASDAGNWPRRRRTSQTAPGNSPQAGVHCAPLRSTFGTIMHARTALAVLLVALTSCSKYADGYSCINPDRGHRDALNNPDPCHENDPDGGADGGTDPQCSDGEFAHWSFLWESPTLLWIGPEDQAPECPRGPATVSYEGRTDLVAPVVCEACTCEPPKGSCALPSTMMASDAACGTQGASTSFNAPTPWDGTCDGTIQTPSGAAHSLTIDPIVMTENGCASGPPVAAKVISLHWNTFARGCDVDLPKGPVDRSICPTDVLLPPGFALCIFRDGENDCPKQPGNMFTERHVFYQGAQDDRQCSVCTCGAPTGSVCKAQVSIYDGNDLTCSPSAFEQIQISSLAQTCLDIQLPGQALGSKSAGAMTYLPGTCPPIGGDSSGSAIPTEPSTLCCVP